MANFKGTTGNDLLKGTIEDDTFDIRQGGTDVVAGGSGDNSFYAGNAFDALDQINGGAGLDTLVLKGNYSAGVVFGSTTLRQVEAITFTGGYSYKLTTHSATVAAGETLKIDGAAMTAAKSLWVDGSAETNGSFVFIGGQSSDTFIGGAMADDFFLAAGGTDTALGGAGVDKVMAGASFNGTDFFDGGAGNDYLFLTGDYSAGLTIDGTMLKDVETLKVDGSFGYVLAVTDDMVSAGKWITVMGENITAGGSVSFNGSAETDGTFGFTDSMGNDSMIGGANHDTFSVSGGGTDIFQGGAGNDSFYLHGKLDATDEIHGGLGFDMLFLDGDYSSAVIFDTFTLSGIEEVIVAGSHDYLLVSNDATVGPGAELRVSAANLTVDDSFLFDGSDETDGTFWFLDGRGAEEVWLGGAGDDVLSANDGGNDSFVGGGGDDVVSFDDTYTTDDYVDGGDGYDSMSLYGDFEDGLAFVDRVKGIELLTLGAGFSYDLTVHDAVVKNDATLTIDASALEVGEDFVFAGGLETNGHFQITGGDGDDFLIGGARNDDFTIERAGDDTIKGGAGGDTFWVWSHLTGADSLQGGSGNDTLQLGADLGGNLVLGAKTLVGVEKIVLWAGHEYSIATHDATVASGKTLTVEWEPAGGGGDPLIFDGSAETNGSFHLTGGGGGDTLRGGAKDDLILGGVGDDKLYGNDGADKLLGEFGKDNLYGGLGNDTFRFDHIEDSTVAAFDVIHDWNAGDTIDHSVIDADVDMDGNQSFTFIGDSPLTGPAQLRVVVGAAATVITGYIDDSPTVDFRIHVLGAPALAASDFVL